MRKDSYHVRTIDKVAMFIIGTINRMPYVIGLASAQRIVQEFHKPSYVGLQMGATTLSGLFARFLNTWMISKHVPYEFSFAMNTVAGIIGLLGSGLLTNFWLILPCVFFLGFSSYFGEALMLCYIPYRKKSDLLKFWSSGTGMAGMSGAGYSLICNILDLSVKYSFLIVAPLYIVYAACFFFIVRKSPPEIEVDQFLQMSSNNYESMDSFSGDPNKLLETPLSTSEGEDNIKLCNCKLLDHSWLIIFNCAIVYFYQYTIQDAFADMCLDRGDEEKYPYIFPLLNLMYQTGLFFARSSLACFKFPRIGIISIIMTCLFALWFANAFLHFFPMYMCCVMMALVGYVGGISYVNGFQLIMANDKNSPREKEIITSWNTFFNSVGITMSTVVSFVIENYIIIKA